MLASIFFLHLSEPFSTRFFYILCDSYRFRGGVLSNTWKSVDCPLPLDRAHCCLETFHFHSHTHIRLVSWLKPVMASRFLLFLLVILVWPTFAKWCNSISGLLTSGQVSQVRVIFSLVSIYLYVIGLRWCVDSQHNVYYFACGRLWKFVVVGESLCDWECAMCLRVRVLSSIVEFAFWTDEYTSSNVRGNR